MSKKNIFTIVLIVLVFVAVETLSYFAYYVVRKESFSQKSVKEKAGKIYTSSNGNESRQNSQKDYLIDPYFGYVAKMSIPTGQMQSINLARSYGFDTSGQIVPDYPGKVFTVAVLGGSVAKYFAANVSDTLRSYIKQLPQAKDKEVVIIGLGNYSYKEPQQLNIINDFIAQGAHFDIVINIDGFNEVSHPSVHNIPNRVSPFFPSGWSDRTGEVSSNESLARLGEITILQNIRAKAARLYNKVGMGVTLGTVWSIFDQLISQRIHKMEALRLQNKNDKIILTDNALSMSSSGKISFGSYREYPFDELYPDIANHWAISSAIIHNTTTASGGYYFHFLQPNQYDSSSKLLSKEESEIAISPTNPYKQGVELGYPLLRTAGEALVISGVDFCDTSNLFLDHPETLYVDDCCHYNKAGEDILVNFIGEHIVKSNGVAQNFTSLQKLNETLVNSIDNPGKTKRLASIVCNLVDTDSDKEITVTGISSIESNDTGRFRWGVGPQTSIKVWAPRKSRVIMTTQFLSATPGQEVVVSANGIIRDTWKDIEYVRTASKFTEKEVSFIATPGCNEIILKYSSWIGDRNFEVIDSDPRFFALMFKTLTIKTLPDT